MERTGYCLVAAGDAELAGLADAGYRLTCLDRFSADRIFLFAFAPPSFDRAALSEFGTVLTADKAGVVLATTEEHVLDLNRLPVELRRIRRVPRQFAAEPTAPAPAALPDSLVWQLVNRVSQDSVLASIRRLQKFYTRYSTTESCRRAMSWVRGKFIEYGCDSTYLDTWSSQYAPNAVGVKRGRVNSRPIYIICGHTDNTSNAAPGHCPGSDDNASGTTAVLEACRVFADMDFDNTVWFIGFAGEEQGLWGSEDFAQRCRARGDSIKGVLNFDMISYGRQNRDSFDVIGKPSNPNCAWLMDFYIAQADTFSSLKTIRIMDPTAEYSDHASFWAQGYVAFCGIEDDFTPKYHTLGDTIGPLYYTNCGTNNWPMATEATRAAVASIAKLAGAHPRTAVAEARPLTSGSALRVLPTVGRAPFAVGPLRPGADSRLQVFDAAGNLVRALPVTENSVKWDGRARDGGRAAAGVYLVRYRDRQTSSTARVLLTR
jgi:hypothetical protein